MTASLLYQPRRRWEIWGAFAAATLIHAGAIVLAERQPKDPVLAVNGDPGIDLTFVPDRAESPPDQIDEAPVLPPISASEDSVVSEENATPPPIWKRSERPSRSVVRPRTQGPSGAASLRAVLALNAPRPEYPYEARRQRLTGSGFAMLTVDPASGVVTDVAMWRSTGSPVLDNAAISGFRRWRFRPGTISKVQTPITFTLTGAAY